MTYRAIDVSTCDPVVPADQAAPVLEWLAIDRLVIDGDYQRDLGANNWKAIRGIAAEFLWARFSAVLVAPIEGGHYAIIDGQHRTHAAAICGFASVPCIVVHVPRAEQARAFVGVNARVIGVSAYAVYKAALAGGEAWAVQARDAVAAGGCQLMMSNGSTASKKPGQVFGVGFIGDMIRAGHGGAITAVLRAIRTYDEAGRVPLYSDFILRPLIRAVASDVAFLRADLVALLRAHDPYKVLEQVARINAAGGLSGAKRATGQAAFQALLRDQLRQVAA